MAMRYELAATKQSSSKWEKTHTHTHRGTKRGKQMCMLHKINIKSVNYNLILPFPTLASHALELSPWLCVCASLFALRPLRFFIFLSPMLKYMAFSMFRLLLLALLALVRTLILCHRAFLPFYGTHALYLVYSIVARLFALYAHFFVWFSIISF